MPKPRRFPSGFVCLAVLLCLAGLSRFAGAIDVDTLESSRAVAARELASGQLSAARDAYAKLMGEIPGHPGIQAPYAQSLVRLGRLEDAAAVYDQLLDEGFGAILIGDPDFAKLTAGSEYADLKRRAVAQSAPRALARTAFEIPEQKFIAEGLAFDPLTRRFFAGSTYLRKVVVREPDGRFRDFVPSADHGLLQVLGMKVDSARSRLVVVTATDAAHLANFKPADLGRSGVLIYRLSTGRFLQATWLPPGGKHLFNDLVLSQDGSAYITDSDEGRIYRLSADGGQLTAVTQPGQFLYPNGIDIDATGERLFVADVRGVFTVDLRTAAVQQLPQAKGISSVDLDGLYLHGDCLIGVQTLPNLERVVAFHLSRDHRRTVSQELLDSADPRLSLATEGVVVGEVLYFVARSFQDAVDEKGVIAEPQRTAPTPILAVRLPGCGGQEPGEHHVR
jgi:hypothetical protein